MNQNMKQRMKRFLPLLGMLIFPVLGWIYAWIDHHPNPKVYSLMTDLDRMIPVVKVFALPYSIWIFYIYVCLIYFFIKDPVVYRRSLITYTICALTCYFIFAIFQTTVPRPVITGNDPVTWVIQFIYNRDQPFNCFPSIHVFSSYMVMKALYKSNFKNRSNQILIYSMSTAIILATLFIKQHAILDAVGGILLADFVYRFLTAVGKKREVSHAEAVS